MPTVKFTSALSRHLTCPEEVSVTGESLMESLNDAFEQYPTLKTYVLDDQGQLRKHMQIFVEGELIRDRESFTDRVSDRSEIFIMQALSGGV